MDNCKNCKNGFKRSDFSFKKYGNYCYDIECCLIENEHMPYRKNDDCCEKYEIKEDSE